MGLFTRNNNQPPASGDDGGLRRVSVYFVSIFGETVEIPWMSQEDIRLLTDKLTDRAHAERIKAFMQAHQVEQFRLPGDMPEIKSQEQFVAYVNREIFPKHPGATINLVNTREMLWFLVSDHK